MSQQLVKKGANGGMVNVNPRSWIEAIKDKNTGQTLVEILQGFNMYFLPYNGNTSATRCSVPTMLRKKGLWITYVKYDGNVYTEWYAADELDDKSWGDSSNWRIGNNTLVGDITISANGNWVINGTETEFKAVGEKGNTPLIRVANNRLQVSYDLGDTYIDVTNNPVYTKFRWLATTGDTQANNVGRIQASTDEGKTWTNMSNDFTNNLHIKKYIGVNESLPTSGIAEGTIYAKGPYYAEDDTLNDNPIYRLWVYAWKGNTLAWQDNGEFQSIAAGVVQETGNSETQVMSQKAVTEKLTELGSKDLNNFFEGKGNTYSSVKIEGLIPNTEYRLFLRQTSWDTQSFTDGGYKFDVSYYADGINKRIFGSYVSDGNELQNYYDFKTPEVFDYYTVGGRAKSGEKIWFYIERIEGKVLLSKQELTEIDKQTVRDNIEAISQVDLKSELLDKEIGQDIESTNVMANAALVDGVVRNSSSDIGFHVGTFSVDGLIAVAISGRQGDTSINRNLAVIYNSSGDTIKVINYNKITNVTDYTIILPVGSSVIKITGNDSFACRAKVVNTTSKFENISNSIDENNSKLLKVSNDIYGAESNYKKNIYLSKEGVEIAGTDWNCTTEYIAVPKNATIVWNIGDISSGARSLVMYDKDYNVISYYGANATPSRTVTVKEGTEFIRTSFYKSYNGEPNTTPLIINGVEYNIYDTIEPLRPVDNKHGMIGKYYPEQMDDIDNKLTYRFSNRFSFIHVSDNHGGNFGYADEFLDFSPAKFLINTGDMVNDKFEDISSSQTVNLATSTQKPCYLVLGNHDYTHAPSKQAVFEAFMRPTHEHNGLVTDKTYYSVNYTEYGIKCIMLDINDGFNDAEYPNLGPSDLTFGKMSAEQINWFAQELKDATTNNLHVCLFIHIVPCDVDAEKLILEFSDINKVSGFKADNLAFLPNMIDAWINGVTYELTNNGTDFKFEFTGVGHFVAWFFGHIHYDLCGFMKDHPNQFMVGVCRPNAGGSYCGSYDGDRIGVHFNYYTIDTFIKCLSVYRVGQQTTVWATERKSFRVFYK